MKREDARMLVQRVLEQAALSMRQIADYAGLNYTTVRRWRSGDRVPGRENRHRLAAAFEAHADRLRELARELREDGDGDQ